MINEFVPYQESLELKELGFDEPCFGYWSNLGTQEPFLLTCELGTEKESCYIRRKNYLCKGPTYSQAFRWFRKKYKLWGNIGMQASDYYTLMVYETLPDCCWILYNNKGYETDEEAELACLRKLISTVKQRS